MRSITIQVYYRSEIHVPTRGGAYIYLSDEDHLKDVEKKELIGKMKHVHVTLGSGPFLRLQFGHTRRPTLGAWVGRRLRWNMFHKLQHHIVGYHPIHTPTRELHVQHSCSWLSMFMRSESRNK